MSLLAPLVAFFVEHFPTPEQIMLAGPTSLLWAASCLWLAGWLKLSHGWPTGYTRKVFHFLILVPAAAVQSLWGLNVLFVFGGATSAIIFFAVWLGDGALLYEAIAREKDAPRRSYFILIAYLATLIGGLLANLLFGSAALVGYLVTGVADAVAEPIGTRFGRHGYRVPSVAGVPARRSLEGSSAVFVASLLALLAVGWIAPELAAGKPGPFALLGIAAACTAVEAATPHGWDNATLQLAASGLFVLAP